MAWHQGKALTARTRMKSLLQLKSLLVTFMCTTRLASAHQGYMRG